MSNISKGINRLYAMLALAALALIIVASFPATAEAKSTVNKDVSKGNIVCDDPNVLYHITGKSTENNIIIRGGTKSNPIEVDLDGVDINFHNDNEKKSTEKAPVRIEGESVVIIYIGKDNPDSVTTLYGGNNHGGNHTGYAGISIQPGGDGDKKQLTISGKGTLNVHGGGNEYGGAGIGSNYNDDISGIVIDGEMTINATGAHSAPGIGSGRDGHMHYITINSGTINATGGYGAPGIGSGEHAGTGSGGDCHYITINGGNITANGGECGAGIGGSKRAFAEHIAINGGTIKATGGKYGAGIGSANGDCQDLKITDGNITAIGGDEAAGIGSGSKGKMEQLEINLKPGAKITATGGNGGGAGIGSGKHSLGDMSITLNGNTIIATGGSNAPGIGSGDDNANKITIKGRGKIYATGGHDGCGIGGGSNGSNGEIVIKGEGDNIDGYAKPLYIVAKASSTDLPDNSSNAAIGSGKASGGDIHIDNALLDLEADGAGAGIGGGHYNGFTNGGPKLIEVKNSIVGVIGKRRSGAGIGAGYGGEIGTIKIINSKYTGNHIGSTCYGNSTLNPNDVSRIEITDSEVEAIAQKSETNFNNQVAGIGSGTWGGVGSIAIKNSTVTAQGRAGAAGIGSGGWGNSKNIFAYHGGNMGDITIENSTITATAEKGGAPIGGGFHTNTGNVTIKDCPNITATADRNTNDGAAAIGGGCASSAGVIDISNSTVTANAGKYSAAIGCSGADDMVTETFRTEVKNIKISGSTITATGGDYGAGIGSGQGGRLGDGIHISNSVVTARGGKYGSGIGAGAESNATSRGGNANDIVFSGKCKIEAHGGEGAAGIGGGFQGGVDRITFDLTTNTTLVDYDVKAYGGAGAAGIGSGCPKVTGHELFTQEGYDAKNITIKGGYIFAYGGGKRNAENADKSNLGSGAGIGGGGNRGTLADFNMSGGVVEARAGDRDALDIGRGGQGYISDTIFGQEHDGSFKITGGTIYSERISGEGSVRISGGSVSSKINGVKNDKTGDDVYRTRLKLVGDSEKKKLIKVNKTSFDAYGTDDIYTDSNGWIYYYLPKSEEKKATSDVAVETSDAARHYYGTTTSDNNGILKMDGLIGFKAPNPEEAQGGDFDLMLDDKNAANYSYDFRVEDGSSARIVETIKADSPGAGVKMHGDKLGKYKVTATSNNNSAVDNEAYWSASASYTGNITKSTGEISIIEDLNKVYDGLTSPKTPQYTTNSNGTVTTSYYKGSNAEGEKMSVLPAEPGTYTVKVSAAATDKFTAAEDSKTFEITPKQLYLALTWESIPEEATIKVTARIAGMLEQPEGLIQFDIIDSSGETIESGKEEIRADNRDQETGDYVLSHTSKEKLAAGKYIIKAKFLPEPDNRYYCNDAEEHIDKTLEQRTMTDATIGTTYGYDGVLKSFCFTGEPKKNILDNALHTEGKTDDDIYHFKIVYDSFSDFDSTISINDWAKGGVKASDRDDIISADNAGYAVVKVTLTDEREHKIYADSVTYLRIKVNRRLLSATSYAYDKETNESVNSATYGEISKLDFGIKYKGYGGDNSYSGFAEGDNADNFNKGHGELVAVPLSESSPANSKGYPIKITKTGPSITYKGRTYDNVFISRNYEINYTEGKLIVTPAALTLKADDVTGEWGREPELTYSYIGLSPWDSSDDIKYVDGKEPTVRLEKPYGEYEAGATYEDAISVIHGKLKDNVYREPNYTITDKSGTLTVNKADPKLKISIKSKTYDKNPAVLNVDNGDYKGDDPVIEFSEIKSNDDGSVTYESLADKAPTDAGEYRVNVKLEANEHFNSASQTKYFTIYKADPDVETPELPDMKYKDGLKLSDQELPDGWKWTAPNKLLAVGPVSSKAHYTPKDTRNYNELDRYLSFNVYDDPDNPVDPVNPDDPVDPVNPDDPVMVDGIIEIVGNPTKVYDGEAALNPAVKKNSSGKVTYTYYSVDASGNRTKLKSAPKNAGEYLVEAEMAATDEVTSAKADKRFKIIKKNLFIALEEGQMRTTRDGTFLTVTAEVFGLVKTEGSVSFKINDGDSQEVAVVNEFGRNIATITETVDNKNNGSISVTADYVETDGNSNYRWTEATREFSTNGNTRQIVGEKNYSKTYGDKSLTLALAPESNKKTDKDTFTYELVYQEFPGLDAPVAVDDKGNVTIEHAGRAIIKATLKDSRTDSSGRYADAVAYVNIDVKRKDLKVSSHAYVEITDDETGDIKKKGVGEIEYGKVGTLKYGLKYDGLVNGDTAEDFTHGGGYLEAIPIDKSVEAFSKGNDSGYSIGIAEIGATQELNKDEKVDMFLCRDYKLKFNEGKVKVTPAKLKLIANDAKGKYGALNEPKYSYKVKGLAEGDSLSDVIKEKPKAHLVDSMEYGKLAVGFYSDAITVDNKERIANSHGEYNYDVEIVNGDLVVLRAETTLDVQAESKVYDKKPAEISIVSSNKDVESSDYKITYYRVVKADNAEPDEDTKADNTGNSDGTTDNADADISINGINDGDSGNDTDAAGNDADADNTGDDSKFKLEPIGWAAPTNAGNYYVKVEISNNKRFKDAEDGAFFHIDKADPEVETPKLPDMKYYDGIILKHQKLPRGWAWDEPDKGLAIGPVKESATYTPDDTDNYNTVNRELTFNVYEEKSGGSGTNTGDKIMDGMIASAVILAIAFVGLVATIRSRKKKYHR